MEPDILFPSLLVLLYWGSGNSSGEISTKVVQSVKRRERQVFIFFYFRGRIASLFQSCSVIPTTEFESKLIEKEWERSQR